MALFTWENLQPEIYDEAGNNSVTDVEDSKVGDIQGGYLICLLNQLGCHLIGPFLNRTAI